MEQSAADAALIVRLCLGGFDDIAKALVESLVSRNGWDGQDDTERITSEPREPVRARHAYATPAPASLVSAAAE
jgi:hypothetical protein